MEKNYKPKDFSQMLNVSVKTLQRWDNEGILKAYRTPTGRRYYTNSQYLEYIGESFSEETKGKVIIYSRVSSRGQKDDLINQTEFLKQFANGRGI
ncbi:MAG: recombinase family protein, partial [Halanaerobiales bacterium]|nr:recombinase family protein [Halanaerobiales bacterium]